MVQKRIVIDFELPKELIAQEPARPRDHARLLVYRRSDRSITDSVFYRLGEFLPQDTLVVANNTRVAHCRYLFDGGKTEIFAIESVNDRTVRALVRPGRRFKQGARVQLSGGVIADVMAIDGDGLRTLVFNCSVDDSRLERARHVPLPPYIAQNDQLAAEYQTVYARQDGSLAAPTAGLHFTPELKKKIATDFGWAEVTLEVGLGTFAALQPKNFETGTLHSEKYSIEPDVYEKLRHASHITAVGTTTARTIESVYMDSTHALSGSTNIFIQPGYDYKRVDALITNFHLPGTSLLLLVEAMVGSELETHRIYQHAIDQHYRFYSFGDAMLII